MHDFNVIVVKNQTKYIESSYICTIYLNTFMDIATTAAALRKL